MKKFSAVFHLIITMSIFITSTMGVYAEPVGFTGGVNNEYEYEEVVFISGEPIHFIGEIKITERERDDERTVTYRFDLEPKDKSIEGELKRTLTLETIYDNKNDKGQTIAETTLTKYSESIEIEEDEYELEDYQFSKSDIIDKRPASDFYSGNLKARKYYTINDDEGDVIIDITGGTVGYENFWGSTETEIIDYFIYYDRDMTVEDEDGDIDTEDISWEGTVKVEISDSTTKELIYSDNMANLSSFDGGYVKVTNSEIVSEYEYDLPEFDSDGQPDEDDREKDDITLSRKMNPEIERLIVPKFRDVNGHWAEDYIKKLYSLDVFEDDSSFFAPDVAMTRSEFTRAMIKACDIRTLMEEESSRRSRREDTEEESPFKDVSTDDSDYKYIKEALEKGIIQGGIDGLFNPESPLTKAQAITIIIRALGFENKAPNPGYYTVFDDDSEIQDWSRDSIYVAKEIGIIAGDNYNKIQPNKTMTRAEASAMLVRFLEFLERDLQRDYREQIMLFN